MRDCWAAKYHWSYKIEDFLAHAFQQAQKPKETQLLKKWVWWSYAWLELGWDQRNE